MFAELIDLTTPTFYRGLETSMYDVAPIPIEGPTTFQLAVAAFVTLSAYAILRRRTRPQLASAVRYARARNRKTAAAKKQSREAA